MRRRVFVAGLVGVAVGAGVGLPTAPEAVARSAPGRPNIVVLMTDDQTAESLRVMPNVRRLLQRRGVTFDDHFASYPLCCPARATYFTGQYSHNHHVTSNDGPTGGYAAFADRQQVVPTALQHAGYTTVHIGKYLNGYGMADPSEVPPGWDDWHGLVDPSTYRYYGFTMNQNGRLHTFGMNEYQTDVEARLARRAIRREARRDQPFYLDVAFLAPHAVQRETSGLDPIDPISRRAVGRAGRRHGIRYPVPDPIDRGRFRRAPLPNLEAFAEADVSDKPVNIRLRPTFPALEWAQIVRNYRQRLETLLSVDRAVATIVGTLAEAQELRNTYIVFVSDNGFFHGEHRIPFGKYLPYEPAIRIPLVISGPGVRRGVHSGALTSDVDLPATILALAGASAPRTLDGRSLASQLRQRARPWARREVLLESGANPVGAPVYSGIRTRRYKYIEYVDGQRELYDLERDPHELVNIASVAETPAQRQLQRRLARRLAVLRDCDGRECP